jgi:hypothetical protein
MTTSSHSRAEWGSPPSGLGFTGGVMTRRRARRLSRRFADVGVLISPGRLRAIAAGERCADDEWIDVGFGFLAVETMREERRAKIMRMRRRSMWWLVVAGVCLAALNFLVCVAYLTLSLAQ